MSLYLCIFSAADEELAGLEVGPYSYFGAVRDLIRDHVQDADQRFPLLMTHPDSDGEWTSVDAPLLKEELSAITCELRSHPARVVSDASWYFKAYKQRRPSSLAESFFDVDGEDLFEGLSDLCDVSIENQLPILFQ